MAAIQARFEVAVPELPDHIDTASYSQSLYLLHYCFLCMTNAVRLPYSDLLIWFSGMFSTLCDPPCVPVVSRIICFFSIIVRVYVSLPPLFLHLSDSFVCGTNAVSKSLKTPSRYTGVNLTTKQGNSAFRAGPR